MKRRISILLIALVLGLTASALAFGPTDHQALTPTEALTPARSPAYPVGMAVKLEADHMPGMEGAPGTISGAYETVLYAVSFTRADTGEEVLWHRWVIQEEIEGFGEAPYQPGDIVTLLSGHISAMGGEGAQAEIVEVMPGVAYMVDYVPTDGSAPVQNHQWLSEEEIHPYEEPVTNG